MRYRLGENCNNNIDIGPEFLEISDWTRTNGNGSRGRLLRGGRGRQRTVAAFSARLHEDDNDGTSCGTRGFVAPLPRREREREREREKGFHSTVVHRFLRVIATVATTARLANPHSTGTSTRADLSKIKGGPGSMRPPRFNLSVAILSLLGLQSSAPLFFPYK